MQPSNGDLIAKMRELAKKKVRKSFVGPWGMESSYDPMALDEFIDEVEKMLETKDKPKMTKHSEYGDLFSLSEFRECVQCGAFIPDDGSGFWATETLQSNLSVWAPYKRPNWATHVMWFNK